MKSNLNSDFGYYNILINNSTDKNIEAKFEETRISPILSHMEDWQLAVVRFKIPTVSIPLFIFEENLVDQPPPNPPILQSPYFIGFSIGSTYASPVTVNVGWLNEFANNTETVYPYSRFIYYYSSFTQMVNRALSIIWTGAKGGAGDYAPYTPIVNPGGDPDVFKTAHYPFIELDDTTSYMRLFLPFNAAAANPSPFVRPIAGGDDYINIHMSSKLFYFFSGFTARYLSTPPALNMDYVLNFSRPILYNNINDLQAWGSNPNLQARKALVVYQDYSCLYLWQTLTRLIMTTNVPIEQEYIGVQNSDGQNFQQVLLTDFEIEPTREGNQRDFIFYFADFPRYCNFTSNGDLRRMDLRIYYQTRDLRTFPLLIPPTFEVSVKIQFKRRKSPMQLQYSQYDTLNVSGSRIKSAGQYI